MIKRLRFLNARNQSVLWNCDLYVFYDHNPPHFHVKYQDYEAIIEINNGIIHGKMLRRALNLIYEWLDIHKNELLENWQNIEQRKPVNRIDSLK